MPPLYDKNVACLLVLLLFTFGAINAVRSQITYFPSNVKICSTKDPNFNMCFTHSANKMLKHLTKGSRELNAAPTEPLHVPLMSLRKNNKLLETLAFNFTDTVHEGWKDAVVLHSDIKPKEREFKMVINIPRYRLYGLYEATGNITGIPVEGSGNMDCTFINMTNYIHMRGHLEERNAQEFLVIDVFQHKSTVDKLLVNFDNLFNDTKKCLPRKLGFWKTVSAPWLSTGSPFFNIVLQMMTPENKRWVKRVEARSQSS